MAASANMQLDRPALSGVSEKESERDSDQALVLAAQGGDRSAFGVLYQRYARMVHGVLLARVPGAVAEDLLQDVFLQALPRLSTLRDASRFGGWLAAIARNRANDYYRRSDPPASGLGDEQPEELREGATFRKEWVEGLFLLEAIRTLPEAYREPLVLRFVEGMTGPEIAARTGMKHGSVRVNLCRGIQMLREKLGRR